jgi:hypothetical protein
MLDKSAGVFVPTSERLLERAVTRERPTCKGSDRDRCLDRSDALNFGDLLWVRIRK